MATVMVGEAEEAEIAEAAEVEPRPAPRRAGSMRERILGGMCASLMVLGVGAAITHTPDGDTRDARQLAAGPAPDAETTTTTAAPTTESTALAAKSEAFAPFGPPPSRPSGPSLVATPLGSSVDIYSSRGAAERTRELASPQPSGAPLVMLVREQQGDWVRVLLPIRPNGSSGWVKRDQVGIYSTNYYIVIGLRAHRITVFNGSSVVLDERIGLGAGGTPTPTGLFFIKELLQPPNPSGAYGPYAYGLSAFSEVLFSFGGGPGTVGVHGTNDPSSLGRNVSNGCIRMSNAGVTRLAKMLPLGVPVQITA